MKYKYIILATVAVILIAIGCDVPNHYHPNTENRPTAPFSGVSLNGVGDVFISTSPDKPHEITVTADMDIIDSVITDVNENGVLLVGESRHENGKLYLTCGGCEGPIDVDVNTPELKGVALAGRGAIKINTADSLGDIPNHLMILHTGNGDINAQNYKTSVVTVVHTGNGNINVWAADTLFVSITAQNGEVLFKGDPVIMMFDHLRLVEIINFGNAGNSMPGDLEFSGDNVNDIVPPTALFDDRMEIRGDTTGLWLGDSDNRVRPSR